MANKDKRTFLKLIIGIFAIAAVIIVAIFMFKIFNNNSNNYNDSDIEHIKTETKFSDKEIKEALDVMKECGIGGIEEFVYNGTVVNSDMYKLICSEPKRIYADIRFDYENKISKISTNEIILFENGEYFDNINNYAVDYEKQSYYLDVINSTLDERYINKDADFIEYNGYPLFFTPDLGMTVNVQGIAKIKDDSGEFVDYFVDANFDGETLIDCVVTKM